MMIKVVLILFTYLVAIECGGPYHCVENGIDYPIDVCVPRGPLVNCTCQFDYYSDTYGSVVCSELKCVPVTCTNAIVPSGQCCEICPAVCTENGTIYQSGERMPSADRCIDCFCDNGTRKCDSKECETPVCLDGDQPTIYRQSGCCPICPPVCRENGSKYQIGEDVPQGPCDICICIPNDQYIGVPVCFAQVECAAVTCNSEPIVPPGKCCAICPPVCAENEITYQTGQSVPRSPCDSCTCVSSLDGQQASVVCAVIECAPVTCNNAFVPPGQCCAICPAVCTKNGITYQSGEIMPNPNPCLECVCDNGQVICSEQMCSDLQCVHGAQPESLEENCCPICPPVSVCLYNSTIYREGERIPDRNPCNMCLCERGEVSCRPVICPPKPDCDGKYRPLGQCCLVCSKNSKERALRLTSNYKDHRRRMWRFLRKMKRMPT